MMYAHHYSIIMGQKPTKADLAKELEANIPRQDRNPRWWFQRRQDGKSSKIY